ncbi:bifunctional hydroxymethylpyrimidine kinase/phosphomethylpyrimidine kinase [Methanolobus chelungpuianus]|uniref:Phosphomethylpyrimidine kinase n=1 Tax=Methanolobus chelungpuianus TaxID=502115 RepID=A0AAE3KXS2_9EURY|nr:bifunctional hydroxymethylpyrimidine kinase/phosphomethylpyrimidine kinase [Methanolobus chelungpuianus]MCQ6963052.1 phosphomethylpyrimidine kinase [Methanolobus chelungpuianus]
MAKATVVMTIAGSDSGGGAGIEADIKTIAALGLHGTCAITSVTSQNTTGVLSAFDLPTEVVASQADAVCTDMEVRWAKSGMLASSDIISTVASLVRKYSIRLVVDPVMAAEAGGSLLRKDAVRTLKEELLPISQVVTPNISEATALSGMPIASVEDAKQAARIIAGTGVKAVIVTGGHLDASDVIYEAEEDRFTIIRGEFVRGGTHGSGCTYAAALTCGLAQGLTVVEAARRAKEFVVGAIIGSQLVGKGAGPVNPLAGIRRDAEACNVLEDVKQAVSIISASAHFAKIIPETGSNIAMALPQARGTDDVAAVAGRIVKLRNSPRPVGEVGFGVSGHVARTVLAAMEHDPRVRAAVNVRYSEEILSVCKAMGLGIASFERSEEPANACTGYAGEWGTSDAIVRSGNVPDIIFDRGAMGKEPMIRILGRSAIEVARIADSIAGYYAVKFNQ